MMMQKQRLVRHKTVMCGPVRSSKVWGYPMMKAAIVLGVLIALAAALAVGRYSLTQQGNMAFEVDRYTGAVWFCTPEGSRVREQPSSH